MESARALNELRALAAELELDTAVEARDRLRSDMVLLAPSMEVR